MRTLSCFNHEITIRGPSDTYVISLKRYVDAVVTGMRTIHPDYSVSIVLKTISSINRKKQLHRNNCFVVKTLLLITDNTF